MQLLKKFTQALDNAIVFAVCVGAVVAVMLFLSGNLSMGCRQAWLTNTITCSANLIIPGK